MRRILIIFLLGLSIGLGWSCRPGNDDSEKLAEVDGTVITQSDIDRAGGKQLQNLRQQLYQLERQKLEEYIGAMLLTRIAKERGVSVSTVLDQEVNKKVPPVSEDEIKNFYAKNRERIRVELDKVHDTIAEYLRQLRIAEQKSEYLKTLRANATITTYLKPPPIQRVDVFINGAPFKGAEKATVTIVKFEDFHCPFCKRIQPVFDQLLSRYDGKLKLVHRDFPIDSLHPQARRAAEAARCAGDQGKFWNYHDILYANAPKAAPEDLKAFAKKIGLEAAAFERCVSIGKFRLAVQKDVEEGAKLGVNGTPTFFINGREISGAQPLDKFATIIDEELAQAQAGNKKNGTQ